MKSPIILQPEYQTRVWGGRTLATLYGRELPGDESLAIGESWDVVDRPEAQSLVVGGEYDGLSLGDLWNTRRQEIFGEEAPQAERFPLLCKILDARHPLSIQVHPPQALAEKLGGEAKSEFWYAAQADPEALWYAGLKPEVTREIFEQSVRDGTTPDCVRQMLVGEGDSLWVPSGRVHALGGGQMIFEIQENSDTTYRVFDWKRSDQGGPKRELHIDKALQCIDFDDVGCGKGQIAPGDRVHGPGFQISKIVLSQGQEIKMPSGFFVMAVVSGEVSCGGASFSAGDYFLLPANEREGFVIRSTVGDSQELSALLCVTWP
ncbi:MAG: class I mannose-6-phosphate isomerase [Verrucomicrobiales bacterium]|nr:class I mannose-6-phosphate isomerase [Verrucomicrobiales bacterium]